MLETRLTKAQHATKTRESELQTARKELGKAEGRFGSEQAELAAAREETRRQKVLAPRFADRTCTAVPNLHTLTVRLPLLCLQTAGAGTLAVLAMLDEQTGAAASDAALRRCSAAQLGELKKRLEETALKAAEAVAKVGAAEAAAQSRVVRILQALEPAVEPKPE